MLKLLVEIFCFTGCLENSAEAVFQAGFFLEFVQGEFFLWDLDALVVPLEVKSVVVLGDMDILADGNGIG